MLLNGRVVRCVLALLLLLLVAGCGGISASHSVSPATFLLPGLGQLTPETTPAQTEEVGADLLVAQAN
jgi:hypothetical protein